MRVLVGLIAAAPLLACPSEPPRDAEGRVITVGRYRIRTYPTQARVFIDGKLEIPATPGTLLLEAGRYELELIHPGAKEGRRETIWVEAGRSKTLDVRVPPPARSTLAVDSDVEGAKVRINGYTRGRTPLEPVTVRAGPVDVTVTTPDGRARTATTHLGWGDHQRMRLVFAAAPPPDGTVLSSTKADGGNMTASPGDTGQLDLILAPPGSVIDAAGEVLGRTPLRGHTLPAGEHTLTLRALDGRYERTVVLVIRAKERALYRFRLGPQHRLDAGLQPAE